MVLQSVGLPLEGIAIVAGIDRILDMFRTTTNIFGDNSAGVVVAALVGELDREVATTPLDKMEKAGGIHLDKEGRIIDEVG